MEVVLIVSYGVFPITDFVCLAVGLFYFHLF